MTGETAGSRTATSEIPRSARVLVFDADPSVCAAAHAALTRSGFDVDVSANRVSVYRVLQSQAPPYDAFVAGCGPLGLPTASFTRYMRTRHPSIAVAIAGRDFDLQRTPCDAWIEAPYEPEALVEIVRGALRSAAERVRRATHAR